MSLESITSSRFQPRKNRAAGFVRLTVSFALAAGVIALSPASAGPLTDITARTAPPPADSESGETSKAGDGQAPASAELPSVIVKGKRQQEEETVRQKLEKVMKPKPPPPPPDLNKAGDEMKDLASWQTDADSYRDHPGDPTHKFNAPAGDETGGCGADITHGCTPHH
jgi:hypothetical protein